MATADAIQQIVVSGTIIACLRSPALPACTQRIGKIEHGIRQRLAIVKALHQVSS